MDKKRSTNCPVDACEKFFKAITASSPFRPNHHHHHPHDSMTTNPAPNSIPFVKTQNHPKPRVASEVEFDYSAATQKKNNNGKVAIVATTRRMQNDNKMNANIGEEGEGEGEEEEEEDEFTKYIKRAGYKIRTTSSVNGKSVVDDATGGEEDPGNNDNFSDYINRAKKRMLRTMSSFVGGKESEDSMK